MNEEYRKYLVLYSTQLLADIVLADWNFVQPTRMAILTQREEMSIPKKIRELVYAKCNGHCAYCGREIAYKDMQVDHIHPQYKGGSDDIDNLLPSCRACNFRKGTLSVEQFRREIKDQCDTLFERSFQARMSLAYGLIERMDKPIVFYFEK